MQSKYQIIFLTFYAPLEGKQEEGRPLGIQEVDGRIMLKIKNKPRGPYSASELYRLSNRHSSTKFSANFCG
jgi:hypothetical protein